MSEPTPRLLKSPIEAAASLVPRCLAGDYNARETLARWCLPKVRRTVLLTYGNGPDGDDLAQTAIARVFSRMDTYRGDSSFYTWVDRITVNAVRDHFRSRRTRFPWEAGALTDIDHESPDVGPAGRFEGDRLMERLSMHFTSIKMDQRLPLALSLAHGYTAPEIAAILEVNLETVKKRLQRGRRALIVRIKKDPYCNEILGEMLS